MQYLLLEEGVQIKPFIGCVFEAAEIEVVAVHINNGFQVLPPLKMKKPPRGRFSRLKLGG